MMAATGRHVSQLSGYAPALPTPFDADGNIDGAAFEQFCERQIQEGATALVVCGTTGEAPTVSSAEHRTLIRIAGFSGSGGKRFLCNRQDNHPRCDLKVLAATKN